MNIIIEMDLQYSLNLIFGTYVSHKTREGQRSEDELIEFGIWIAECKIKGTELLDSGRGMASNPKAQGRQ